MYPQIIDANLNRVSEGLRVIEEYTRFVWKQKVLTDQLAALRKKLNTAFPQSSDLLHIRDITQDMRAKETPQERTDVRTLLIANFKRAQEGLRVLEEYTGQSIFNQARYDLYQLEKHIILPLSRKDIKKGIYLISADVDVLKKGVEWGVSLIQLRDKYASKSELLERAKQVQEFAKGSSTLFIINDFIDIALLVDADGFHTGQDDISLKEIRSILGEHKILGRTTHSLEQGLEAEKQGADYVSVGPIWETPSKPGRAAIGFDYLKTISQHLSIPYVAIGGINAERFPSVMEHQPPLVGLVRDYQHIPEFLTFFKS